MKTTVWEFSIHLRGFLDSFSFRLSAAKPMLIPAFPELMELVAAGSCESIDTCNLAGRFHKILNRSKSFQNHTLKTSPFGDEASSCLITPATNRSEQHRSKSVVRSFSVSDAVMEPAMVCCDCANQFISICPAIDRRMFKFSDNQIFSISQHNDSSSSLSRSQTFNKFLRKFSRPDEMRGILSIGVISKQNKRGELIT